jgi:hypothetical protein
VDGEAVLFGGCPGVLCSASSVSNATWTYSDGNWTRLNLSVSPPGRSYAQMAWDPAIQAIVLFGGSGCTDPPGCTSMGVLNDTWTFTHNVWTEQFPPVSPGPAEEGAMAFDPSYPGVVLYGQDNGCYLRCGTWVYADRTWTLLSESVSPAPRYGEVMATDPVDDGVLLFGGVAGGDYVNDTWLFSRGSWTQRFPAHAPALRAEAAIASDPATGQPVLFGGEYVTLGNFPGTTYRDAWSYNGSDWSALEFLSAGPPALSDSAMALDPSSNDAVLVGGCGPDACANSQSWVLGTGERLGFVTNASDCVNASVGTLRLNPGIASATLLNGTYPLAVDGCGGPYTVQLNASGAVRVSPTNLTTGWVGTLTVYGPGTLFANLTPPRSCACGPAPVATLFWEAPGPLFLLLVGVAAAAAVLGVLVHRRRRRAHASRPPEAVPGWVEPPEG